MGTNTLHLCTYCSHLLPLTYKCKSSSKQLNLNIFVENISAGRGFIALAAVVFGQWNPVGAMFSALLFGVADALQLRLQTISNVLPYQLLATIPYVLTVLALVGVVGRATPPKSLAKPYIREGRG